MMKKKEEQEEEEDEELDVWGNEPSESSHDLESSYVPSSSSSEAEEPEGKTKSTLRKPRKTGKLAVSATKDGAESDRDKRDGDNIDDYNADTDVDKDTDDEDGDDCRSSGITVKTCRRGDKRKWDKKHYCVFCKKTQTKMARHLMRKHSNEKEVAQVMCLPLKSKKRKQILEQLRRRGDYYHNITVLQEGKGEIVTYRQPSEHTDAENYLPCNICYGFFLKTELWRHEKVCRKAMTVSSESKKKRRVQSAASSLLPYSGQSSQRCSAVVSRMVIDKVSTEVKNDPLICEFGDRLLEKHGNDRTKDGHVSQKMRELGRFLLAAKSLDRKVKSLQDVLVPPKFSLAVAAAKKASGFTNSAHRYNTPSLALKLGHSLKAACDIVIGQHVKAEDESAANRVRNFLGLVAAEWDLYVSRRARTNLEEERWNKKEMIPLTEDVMKLHKVLKSAEEEAKDKLQDGPNPTAYKTLSECLLAQIILFNRRRQGEAAKMPLVTYRDRAAEQPNEDIMQCLSRLEKDLSHEFTRLVVRGKRGRKVPVLLTKEMTSSLDFLIGKRGEDNDILESNTYVFARQNTDSHIRGSDCLRKYAALSGAKRPETLTSTQLRKHVATLSQIMNLKDHELDQLAKFMGHDIRVHREYYRLTENTLQLAKMSKLLMAIELGTDVYKGRSLYELDLGLENGAMQESQVMQSNAEIDSGGTLELPEDMDASKSKMTMECPWSSSCADEGPQSPSISRPLQDQRRAQTASKRKRTMECPPPSSCSDEGPQSPSISRPLQDQRRAQTDMDLPKAVRRRSWSQTEKDAVCRQLGKYISLQKVPRKEHCMKALEAEPALKRRTWQNVKNHVYNTIISRRRKST